MIVLSLGDVMKKEKNYKIIFYILFIIICTLLYSRYISTSGLKIKEYKIINENLTDNFNGLKIVHLSDIHYGRTINDNNLERIINKINEIKPDIVLITGDLIDKDTTLTQENIDSLINILSKIDVTIDKYAIKGNHDYKFNEWENIISSSNFIFLNNNYELIYKDGYEPILIAGINSVTNNNSFIEEYNKITNNIKNSGKKTLFNILLVHEPDSIDNVDINNFNLILAGHSHNGQVRLPFIGAIIKPNGAKKYYDKYYKINNTDLYISSGLGTSDLNFRFFNKPSFNLYKLSNK